MRDILLNNNKIELGVVAYGLKSSIMEEWFKDLVGGIRQWGDGNGIVVPERLVRKYDGTADTNECLSHGHWVSISFDRIEETLRAVQLGNDEEDRCFGLLCFDALRYNDEIDTFGNCLEHPGKLFLEVLKDGDACFKELFRATYEFSCKHKFRISLGMIVRIDPDGYDTLQEMGFPVTQCVEIDLTSLDQIPHLVKDQFISEVRKNEN